MRWNGTGGGGGRGVGKGVGEGGAGDDLRFGTVPAGVVSLEVLAVMVLVDPPAGFMSALPGDFSSDDGWLVISAAEKRSLASGNIAEGYNVLLFAAILHKFPTSILHAMMIKLRQTFSVRRLSTPI